MDLKRLFTSKKEQQREKDMEAIQGEMKGFMLSIGKKMIPDEIIETGRTTILDLLIKEKAEYTVTNLRCIRIGMEMMLGAGGKDNVQVPLLMTQLRLIEIEEQLESITNTK